MLDLKIKMEKFQTWPDSFLEKSLALSHFFFDKYHLPRPWSCCIRCHNWSSNHGWCSWTSTNSNNLMWSRRTYYLQKKKKKSTLLVFLCNCRKKFIQWTVTSCKPIGKSLYNQSLSLILRHLFPRKKVTRQKKVSFRGYCLI